MIRLLLALGAVLYAASSVHLAAPAQAQAEPLPICAPDRPLELRGVAPARAGLLLLFGGRVVGGGQADAGGRYRLTLAVGDERPGSYPVAVRLRDGGQDVQALRCLVPDPNVPSATPVPTPVPTATPMPSTTPVASATPVPPLPAPPTPADTPVLEPTIGPASSPTPRAPDLAVQVAPTTPSVLTTTVQLRAGYDRNENRLIDLDEGIRNLAVYLTDETGQLLGEGMTDEAGAVQIPVAAPEQATLTLTIPYFSVGQQLSLARPRAQPVLIPGTARLPAVLP